MMLGKLCFNGYVFGQSGVQGFFGEGDEYPHHKWYKLLFGLFGFSFKGIVFVAKTFTLNPRIYPAHSNTELHDGYKLKRMFPKSVWCTPLSFIRGHMLNTIGLANPGAPAMLGYNKFQKRKSPFQLSIMLMSTTLEEKLSEVENLCTLIDSHMLRKNYAIQLNDSCPNTGHDNEQDVAGSILILKKIKQELPDIPIIVKYDLTIQQSSIVKLKPYCDGFCISNSMAFGSQPEKIEWNKLFKNNTSPLVKHFGEKFKGGLSGAPLFPLLIEWLQKMEALDAHVNIIAGGGIMTKKHIKECSRFKCVRGVALGSVAILRPWRLQRLIRYGNTIFTERFR